MAMEKGRNYPQTGHRWMDPHSFNNWPPRQMRANLDFDYSGNHYSGTTSLGNETVDVPNLRLFWGMNLLGLGPHNFDVEVLMQVYSLDGSLSDHRITITEQVTGDQAILEGQVPWNANNFPWDIFPPLNWPMNNVSLAPPYGTQFNVNAVAVGYF